MLAFFYNTIIFVFTLLYFPYLLVKGKWHEGMPLRLGWKPLEDSFPRLEKPRIWIHAVSVGETLAVSSLIRRLKERYPAYALIVTTVTPMGNRIAEQQLPDDVVVLYAPVDFSWIVRRFVDVIQPVLYITAETEIWPNLFSHLKRRGIPVVIVNGRISERAFRRYVLIRPLLKFVLSAVKCFCMQSQADAQKIIDLGAESGTVNVTGNVKFDDLPQPSGKSPVDWGYSADQMLLVGGSTHPGEEEVLLRQYQKLMAEFPALRLILAPRHIERVGDVIRSITVLGFKPVCFSRLSQERGMLKKSDSVFVIDEIGQLRRLYEIASIVFIGKSLCGRGGQNIIEPAFYSKPIIVGPHMENFAKIFEVFEHAEAVAQIPDEQSLYDKVRHFLLHPSEARQMGEMARRVVDLNRGATERTIRLLEPFLPKASRVK